MSTEQKDKPKLIPNPSTAIVAIILTGLVALSGFRTAFSKKPYYWHPYLHLSMLPKWGQFSFDLGFYFLLLLLFVSFSGGTRGKERILVAGWFPDLFMNPLKALVPLPAVWAIRQFQAISLAVSFLAAISIFLEIAAREITDGAVETQEHSPD